jgi:hypothetical protein
MAFSCLIGRWGRRRILSGYLSGHLRVTGRKACQPRLEDLLDALGVCFDEPILLTHAAMRPQCGGVTRVKTAKLGEEPIA